MFAALLLFLLHAAFTRDAREVITVDVPTQQYLIQQEQDLRLNTLSEQEKKEIIDSYVDDEILVREARKQGLDNTSRIRQLLIQNMRFFVASDLPQPSEEELKSWFEKNVARFESPAAVSYHHVFFSDPTLVPDDILSRLRAGEDHTRIGQNSIPGSRLSRMSQRMLYEAFGSQTAQQVLAIEDETWHGPYSSPQGIHFLRIVERHPPRRPTFEQAKNWLEQDWLMQKQHDIMADELDRMRRNYRIAILPPGADTQ